MNDPLTIVQVARPSLVSAPYLASASDLEHSEPLNAPPQGPSEVSLHAKYAEERHLPFANPPR